MSQSNEQLFHPLKPGHSLANDWCNFPVPENIEVGEHTVIDSSSCFKKFFSRLPVGLKLGKHITLQSPELATEAQGYIEVGDYSYLSSACIASYSKIIIGSHVFIAGGVTIVDTDFHPMDASARLEDTIAISTVGDKSKRPKFSTLPVTIEDGVWIGFNATILKGVNIGKGSVVEPGAVISKDVPPYSIAYGNPAQIKPIEDE
jgi:acetyltransferase-like isoleucine patch superfamily enzyme